MTERSAEKALIEACLRLAWYVRTYDAIPESEKTMLARVAIAETFGRPLTPEQGEIVKLAHDIREHLYSLSQA